MTTSKSKSHTRDSLILASSVFVVFGCIGEAQIQAKAPEAPEATQPAVAKAELGDDGIYKGSSFTGHRSLSEFGLEIQQSKAGFENQDGANTRFEVTTYAYLRGDAEMPRRVRIHSGRSCFFRGDVLVTRELRPVAASQHADGVSSEYFSLDFSLAERVLVHEVYAEGSWVESNCTVTQHDQA